MQELIANVDHLKFDLEIAVEQQLGAQPLPFPGMDSKLIGALKNLFYIFNVLFLIILFFFFLTYKTNCLINIFLGQKTFNNGSNILLFCRVWRCCVRVLHESCLYKRHV